MLTGHCHCESVKWVYPLDLQSVTACNCTLCSRYGALWAYGHLEEGVQVSGETTAYMRGSKVNAYHFCNKCGCIAYYLSNTLDKNNQRRIAVNLRMISDPKLIAHLPIDHFEGLDTFEDLPQDGRTVADLWF